MDEELIQEFLKEGTVKSGEFKRSMKLYLNFFGPRTLIYRKDVSGGGNDFRSFLAKEVKNVKSRNRIILTLERFFKFLISYQKIMGHTTGIVENPFSREWDYYSGDSSYFGTKRIALEKECLDDLKMICLEKEESSVRNLIFLMLSLPLRGIQAQLLDSGLKDEWIYENETMVKNKEGIKCRSLGLFKLLNGKKVFFINTNKSGQAFYIPCSDEKLWDVLLKQRNSFSIIDRKIYGKESVNKERAKIIGEKYDLLFRNEDGTVISKSQMYRFWNNLCVEVENRFGWELTHVVKGKRKFSVDLHSLRVSLTSLLVSQEELSLVSRYMTGHTNQQITIGYFRNNRSLSDEIKMREKLIEYKEVNES